MQFTIERETFLKALSRVQGIVEKRNTIPILSNVLIEAQSEGIWLVATDLEVGMRASYPAQVSAAGKITVSAKKIYEIIRELPDRQVSFAAKENCWIEIRCGKALFNIVGLSPEEFPYFPEPGNQPWVSLEAEELREMIDKTVYSISTDETKYNLNGILFREFEEEAGNTLRLVATDGHRLAMIQKKTPPTQIPQLKKGIILPRKGVQELRKVAEEGEGKVELAFMDNNAIVRKGQVTVVMRLVDGEFPDYTRVIPKTRDQEAIIPRDQFLHALKRIAILASERSRGVKVRLAPGVLEVSSSNPELGEAREDFEIDYQGPETSIGFNARYMIDILQSMGDEQVVMVFKDNISPAMITPTATDDYQTVVMPMRL